MKNKLTGLTSVIVYLWNYYVGSKHDLGEIEHAVLHKILT